MADRPPLVASQLSIRPEDDTVTLTSSDLDRSPIEIDNRILQQEILTMNVKDSIRKGVSKLSDCGIDRIGGTLAVAPPTFAVFELSTPMLLARTPSYRELYLAYRYRRALAATRLGAEAALLWRAHSAGDNMGLTKGVAIAVAGLAGVTPFIYDPLLFKPRENAIRVRPPETASEVLSQNDTEVIGVRLNGEARAYPVRKAARPHLITDTLGGERIVVSYCGLTNSAIVYRPVNGRTPDLAVVSAPNNNILYWDANTDSLIQQLYSEPAYGSAADDQEVRVWPATYTTWSAWQDLVPDTTLADPQYESLPDRIITKLMRRIHKRTRVEEEPFLAVAGEVDHTIHPKARVFALEAGGEARAYTEGFLTDEQVVIDTITEEPIVIFYDADHDIARAYMNELNGHQLSFQPGGDHEFTDNETGTRWDVLGRAIAGPHAGRRLDPVPLSFDKIFWFAWKQYYPNTELFHLAGDIEKPETADIGPKNAG